MSGHHKHTSCLAGSQVSFYNNNWYYNTNLKIPFGLLYIYANSISSFFKPLKIF